MAQLRNHQLRGFRLVISLAYCKLV